MPYHHYLRAMRSARLRSSVVHPVPFLAFASLLRSPSRTFSEESNPPSRKKSEKARQEQSQPIFDVTKIFEQAKTDFWNSNIFTDGKSKKKNAKNDDDASADQEEEGWLSPLEKLKSMLPLPSPNEKDKHQQGRESSTAAGSFQEQAKTIMDVLSGSGSEKAVNRMVEQARQNAEAGEVADHQSLDELLKMFQLYLQQLDDTARKYLGDIELSALSPAHFFYYIEHEDAVKNPSYKRRMHRFYPGINLDQMDHLNDALQLADLAYEDTVGDIKAGLKANKAPYHMIYCDTSSEPNKPAHFIALKRQQSIFSTSLEVLLCVRGTKTFTDAITDLLCVDVDYRGGKAHSGVLEAGKYLAKKHTPLLEHMLKSSGKRKIRLTLLGHSLGAGAAAIACIEFNDHSNIEATAVGFGCPAILSEKLAEKQVGRITTVVADDDLVPRLSGAAAVNALLNIMQYNYLPCARRDIHHALEQLRSMFPVIISKDMVQQAMKIIDPLLDEYVAPLMREPTQERLEPVLFPPGKCIHFYRDGWGVSSSVVPCSFFNELAISRRMVDDHLFFSGYQQIFLELMRLHHRDHNFKFDHGDSSRR